MVDGFLDKVSIITLVEIESEKNIPVVYTEATDSLNLLSSKRIVGAGTRIAPNEGTLYFSQNPDVGLREIEQKYLKKSIQRSSVIKNGEIYDIRVGKHKERFGKVKGMVLDLHYRAYDIGPGWKLEDFKEGVMFISAEELARKMNETEDVDKITMMIEDKEYRVNRGVTYTVDEIIKKLKI